MAGLSVLRRDDHGSETPEQTHRRLGHETAEETSLRLGLATSKTRRRWPPLRATAVPIVAAFVAVAAHFFQVFGFGKSEVGKALILAALLSPAGDIWRWWKQNRADEERRQRLKELRKAEH